MDGEQSDLIVQYKECLRLLKQGDCWCHASVASGTTPPEHSKGCLLAQRLMQLENKRNDHGKE